MHYFAYGSNIHPVRLEKRIGDCSHAVIAMLEGARLSFAKRGLDESGKCDLDFTGVENDRVIGALYQVSSQQRHMLDVWEAKTCGYESISTVVNCQGKSVEAFTYKATKEFIDALLLPFDWYKRLVVLGGTYFNFPQDYLRRVEDHPSIVDRDSDRALQNSVLVSELEQVNAAVSVYSPPSSLQTGRTAPPA